MKKFLSIVLMILLVMSPVMVVEAKTTTTKKTTTTVTTKKTAKKSTKKTTTKKTTTEETKEKKNPINVYVFHSSSCPHCADLRNFLSELKEDKTYGSMFKVVEYEVTSSSENSDLMDEVVAYFHQTNPNHSVPVYVIGEKIIMDGFSEKTHADIVKEAIKTAYEKQPVDEVAKLIEEFNNKKDSNIIGYVVLAVVAVIIVGVIYSSSKNKYYDDEVDSEEVEETPVKEEKKESTKTEVKKTESKKTDSKKTSTTTKKKTTKKKAK